MLFDGATAIVVESVKYDLCVLLAVPEAKLAHRAHKLLQLHQAVAVLVVLAEHGLRQLHGVCVGLDGGIVLKVVLHELLLFDGAAPIDVDLGEDVLGLAERGPHPQLLHGRHELVDVQKPVAVSVELAERLPGHFPSVGTTALWRHGLGHIVILHHAALWTELALALVALLGLGRGLVWQLVRVLVRLPGLTGDVLRGVVEGLLRACSRADPSSSSLPPHLTGAHERALVRSGGALAVRGELRPGGLGGWVIVGSG
mmetsp:Transcript_12832/g.23280  ORF Transcript_12832/g.23280 Transcript_12832/m.23280 type:complete len:256 (-) Transcript_12832:646-1413(-)